MVLARFRYANYNGASLTGDTGGTVAITATQIGTFTLESVIDNRFEQSWNSGANSDTIGVRGRSATGMGNGEGFNLDFTPGTIGDFRLTTHLGDFSVAIGWNLKADGVSISSGTLSGTTNEYDEGTLVFDFTTASGTENFDLELTSDGGPAMLIGGVSLQAIPEPSSTALLGLGGLALILRRRK